MKPDKAQGAPTTAALRILGGTLGGFLLLLAVLQGIEPAQGPQVDRVAASSIQQQVAALDTRPAPQRQ
jgi:hypothetical protein